MNQSTANLPTNDLFPPVVVVVVVVVANAAELLLLLLFTGSSLRRGDVAACPLRFILCLCLFVSYMTLSTVFHSINSPDNSPLSHSVLPVLFLPYWSFQLYLPL